MDQTSFVASDFGVPYQDGSTGWSFWAFKPAPVPRELTLETETILALSKADAALGRLAGAGRHLHDPAMFVRPYMTREALASSRIEGTQASLSDVFEADAEGVATHDVREVWNYRAAMDAGLQQLPDLPLIRRVVEQIHGILLRGVRGEEKQAGSFRRDPVWIGSPTDSPENAVFVPPFKREMLEAWRDWEAFANTTPRLPTLVQCALLHYQFETIHPFPDGNGRLGRLLIVFFLIHRRALPAPLLYISSYLEQNRREYYERLQAVRERAEIQEWLQFFLTAVAVQAEDAISRAEHLHDLRERYRATLAGSRSRAVEVVDLLFVNPVVTVSAITGKLGITAQGAAKLVRQLEERGLVRLLSTRGRGGRHYWIAEEIFAAVSDPVPPNRAAEPLQVTIS